jgi:simple sugar transport system permease protein
MMGAVFTTWVLRFSDLPSILTLMFAFGAGIVGGGLWALIAGYLKTKAEVNEIFAGLGLNFVAQGIILWLIFGPWRRPGIASMSGTEVFAQELWLPSIAWLRLSPVSLIMVFGAIFITASLLNHTRLGLFLKAIGHNSVAAFLYNLKPGTYMLIAMAFAGGFAGLAGSLQVTGVYHRLLPSISSGYGYLALLVVMLANYNIWFVPAVAFFFSCLNVGSIQLPMMLQLDSSLSGVIQGALVLVVLAANYSRNYKTSKHKAT